MKKRILSLILVMCMIASLMTGVTLTASAATSGTCGDNITWILDDGTLTISGSGDMKKYESPWRSYDIKNVIIEQGVTNIGNEAFWGCENLTNVNIPNTVTKIGDNAFRDCSSITSMTIPNSVTDIGYAAFYGCNSLTCVIIPDSVTNIKDSTFSDCFNLTSATIPDSVTSIGTYAFHKCSSLTNVTIPNSVTSIGWYAFSRCDSLTNVTIPDSVTNIDKNAFFLCSSLTSVILGNSLTSVAREVFSGCSSLTSVTIPDSVTYIGYYAFSGCNGLTNVTIPDSVTDIQGGAFKGCTDLTDVYYSGSEEQWRRITIGANNECLTNATIHYNNGETVPAEDPIGFDLTKDGWSITNSEDSFSYPDSYLFPMGRYYEVGNDIKATFIISVKGWQALFGSTWGGNCFGMSSSAVLNYKNEINLKPYFSKNKFELNNYGYDYQANGVNAIRYSNDAIPLIERIQLSQETTQFSSAEVFKTGNHKDKFNDLIEYLNGNDPTPLVLCLSNDLGGHAVVTNTVTKPFKTTVDGNDDFYAIHVYDPNTPYDGNNLSNPSEVYDYYEQRFVYVNPKNGAWYYQFNPLKGKEKWWGDTWSNYFPSGNSTFKCYDVTKYGDKFINNNLTIEPPVGQTYAFVSGSNIELDSNGNKFAVSGIEQKINSDVEYMPFYGVPLDYENEKFIGKVVFDNGKISASDMESADVVYFSNDNILSISVDDDSEYEVDAENNKVTLNTSNTALFDIALDNENSTEFSAVRINGTSSSGEITISLDDNGVINIDGNVNDVDAQVTVEGSKKGKETFKCDDIKELDGYSINDTSDNKKTSFGSQVSEWAKEEVEEAYDENLVPEVLVGKDLTQKVDRAEFATIAVALYENLTGSKATKSNNPFNDIYGNACEDDILKAYNLDITTGTSATTFDPNTNITREQMATMLTRAYKKSEFKDWSIAKDADYPLNFMGVQKFADDNEISDYAKESVYFMARWDIIKGVGDNKFAPKNSATLGESYGYATREQAVIIALRSAKHL